jgi:hypothetical protein
LCLWYSGVRETADDVIKFLLPTYSPDEIVLISDDRQLNYAAQECGIVSVSPSFFSVCMQEKENKSVHSTIEQKTGVVKTTSDDNYELDVLMRVGDDRMLQKKETDGDKNGIFKDRKSSKIERRLQSLMRKL